MAIGKFLLVCQDGGDWKGAARIIEGVPHEDVLGHETHVICVLVFEGTMRESWSDHCGQAQLLPFLRHSGLIVVLLLQEVLVFVIALHSHFCDGLLLSLANGCTHDALEQGPTNCTPLEQEEV